MKSTHILHRVLGPKLTYPQKSPSMGHAFSYAKWHGDQCLLKSFCSEWTELVSDFEKKNFLVTKQSGWRNVARKKFTKEKRWQKYDLVKPKQGIRKIHGPTDTRTPYTDLLFFHYFWKLEKYTDPLGKYTDPLTPYTDLLFIFEN